MQNNLLILCLFLILMGCSSNDELDQSDYKNVFEDNNIFPLTKESGRSNSKIDQAKNLKNIFNAQSYNIKNPIFDYPLEKIWEINTDQDINDENPFLSEPIVIFALTTDINHLRYYANVTNALDSSDIE